MNQFNQYWDSQAKVPFLLGKSIQTFVSYYDPQSIAEKAQYINQKKARGAIIWEITGDYIETSAGSGVIGQTPLADKLNQVLCNLTNVNSENGNLLANLVAFPNPSKGNTSLIFKNESNEDIMVEVINTLGEIVLKQNFSVSKGMNYLQLELPLGTGIYLAFVKSNQKQLFTKIIINR